MIKPFNGLRPHVQYAQEVLAPPYDIVNSEEARVLAENKPLTFLHITKAEIDFPADNDPHDPKVYLQAQENFKVLLKNNILEQDTTPCYYLYRIDTGKRVKTGLVATVSMQAYLDNKVRLHELTRADKEADRAKFIDTLNAQISPVMLTYRSTGEVEKLYESILDKPPLYSVNDHEGNIHQLWQVTDQYLIDEITHYFDTLGVLYIADGHHRCAAAAQVAKIQKENEGAQSILSVLYPQNELCILGYHRVVKDLNGMNAETLLIALSKDFTVKAVDHPLQPSQSGEIGMYVNKQWYCLNLHENLFKEELMDSLEVSILAQHILEPFLNIHDQQKDKRIEFVGGEKSLGECQQRVDHGDMAVAFTLYPTSIEQLLAVSDQEKIMPTKSTWFEPKLADGLISYKW